MLLLFGAFIILVLNSLLSDRHRLYRRDVQWLLNRPLPHIDGRRHARRATLWLLNRRLRWVLWLNVLRLHGRDVEHLPRAAGHQCTSRVAVQPPAPFVIINVHRVEPALKPAASTVPRHCCFY